MATSDLRIRFVGTGDAKRHTFINPRVLVEVLSPSTEVYDRGEKLRQQIPELEEVVLVAHDRREIEIVRRLAAADLDLHVIRIERRAAARCRQGAERHVERARRAAFRERRQLHGGRSATARARRAQVTSRASEHRRLRIL